MDVCTDIDNPSSTTLSFTGCSLAVTTTPATFKIRVTPKTHANMPAVPGASYATTATVTIINIMSLLQRPQPLISPHVSSTTLYLSPLFPSYVRPPLQ